MQPDLHAGPVDRFRRVSMVASALTGDVTPREVVDIVLRQGMAGLGAIGGLLGLTQDGYLHPAAVMGGSADVARQVGAFTLDRQFPVCVAARTGEGVFVTRTSSNADEYTDFIHAYPAAAAWAALPLMAGTRPFGALGLAFEVPCSFDQSEREFFTALASVAALRLRPWLTASSIQLDHILGVTRIEGVLTVDTEGVITNVNERLGEMFGHEPAALIGAPVETIMPERFRSRHRSFMMDYLTEPIPRPMGGGMSLLGLRADGREFPIDVSLSPCISSNGLTTVAVIREQT